MFALGGFRWRFMPHGNVAASSLFQPSSSARPHAHLVKENRGLARWLNETHGRPAQYWQFCHGFCNSRHHDARSAGVRRAQPSCFSPLWSGAYRSAMTRTGGLGPHKSRVSSKGGTPTCMSALSVRKVKPPGWVVLLPFYQKTDFWAYN